MNVEDPKTIQDAIDHAAKDFGGVVNDAMSRLEIAAERFAKLLERVDGAMVIVKLGEPK
jgi:hypothetical protein